jgi:DNA-binding MarR family transcriptional regulator
MQVTLNLANMRKLDVSVSEAVVLALAWDKKNQNASGQCIIRRRDMAEMLNITREGGIKILRRLEQKNYIQRQGEYFSLNYRELFDKLNYPF